MYDSKITCDSTRRPGLNIQVLGGFNAWLDGANLSGFTYEKLKALLVFLALQKGKVFHREWLAEFFWPNLEGEASKQNLRRALSNLRQLIGEDKHQQRFLLSTRSTVSLMKTGQIHIDAECFQEGFEADFKESIASLEARVELYQGDFLAGFALSGCPEFERWCEEQRDRVRHRRAEILTYLVRHYQAEQNIVRATYYAARLVELDPWDESNTAILMNLQARTENIKAALETYERCCRILRDELGLRPSETLQRLAEQLRRRVSVPQGHALAVKETNGRQAQETNQSVVLYCHWGGEDHKNADRILQIRRKLEQLLQSQGIEYRMPHALGLLIILNNPVHQKSVAMSAYSMATGIIRVLSEDMNITVTSILHAEEGFSDREQSMATALALRAFAAPGDVLVSASVFAEISEKSAFIPLKIESPMQGGVLPLFRWQPPYINLSSFPTIPDGVNLSCRSIS